MNDRAVRLYVFYCSNNLEAAHFSDLTRVHQYDAVKTISLPCSGKIDIPYLIKAFETGADGVAIVTCRKEDCSTFEGNIRAHKRAEAVESLLEEIGVDAGRMAVFESLRQDTASVFQEIRNFIEHLRCMPPTYHQTGTDNTQEITVA